LPESPLQLKKKQKSNSNSIKKMKKLPVITHDSTRAKHAEKDDKKIN
jgi:hypothetical protein